MEVIVEAKKEYTKKLNNILINFIITKINDCYNSEHDTLEELRNIPEWNNVLLSEYVNSIKEKYNFLDELITAVFISHVKILSSVKINDKKQTIKLKVPDTELFIHKVLTNFAEIIYYNSTILPLKKEIALKFLNPCIENTISELLPFESILNMYIKENEEEEEEPDEGEIDESPNLEEKESFVNDEKQEEEQDFSDLMNEEHEEPKTVPLNTSNVSKEAGEEGFF